MKYILFVIALSGLTLFASQLAAFEAAADSDQTHSGLLPEIEEEEKSFVASLRSEIIAALRNVFSPPVTVFIVSMLPVFELRGSIPVGINMFGMNWPSVWLISIIGNMVPIFFILLFFDWVARILSKIPIMKRLLDWLFERTRRRSKLIEKYEELALILFVAIPLPITGAWTGSLAAYLLGLRFWHSILNIFIGVLIASIIVTTLSLMGKMGGIIALTVLTLFFLCRLIDIKRKKIKRTQQ